MNSNRTNIELLLILGIFSFTLLVGMVPVEPNNAAGHHWLFTSGSYSVRIVGEFDLGLIFLP